MITPLGLWVVRSIYGIDKEASRVGGSCTDGRTISWSAPITSPPYPKAYSGLKFLWHDHSFGDHCRKQRFHSWYECTELERLQKALRKSFLWQLDFSRGRIGRRVWRHGYWRYSSDGVLPVYQCGAIHSDRFSVIAVICGKRKWCPPETVVMIWRNFDSEIVKMPLDWRGDQVQTTEGVIKAIASNWENPSREPWNIESSRSLRELFSADTHYIHHAQAV